MYSLRAVLQKQPVAIAGALRSILFVLVLAGVIVMDSELLAGIGLTAEVVLGLFVWNATTPAAAPRLKAGTEVSVQGSTDSVVIATSPPGPVGIEGEGT